MASNRQTYNDFSFGIDSKFGEFFFRHPWHMAFIFFLLIESTIVLVERNFVVFIKSSILLLSVLIINLLIAHLFTRNYCYKVIININQNKIIFFPFFNQGRKSEKIDEVKVVIHRTCDLLVHNNKYTILPSLIHEIVAYLPRDTTIEYFGYFGHMKERAWDKNNNRLTPGKYD